MREPGRTALPRGLQSRVLLLVSGLYLANRSDSVFPGGAGITQPRWMPARILGGGWTHGISF